MQLVTFCLCFPLAVAQVRGDEEVVFFPTYAHFDGHEERWVVGIHGWIFEPEESDVLRNRGFALLRDALGLKEGEERTALFKKRGWPFLVDNERGKRVQIRIGTETFTLPASRPNGHFRGTLHLRQELVKAALGHDKEAEPWLPFRVVTRSEDERVFAGKVQLLRGAGLSVISDIDDTIKVSQVGDKRALLVNTFLREFQAVEGMPELYRRWHKAGAAFHYVSDSPWQLYAPLKDLLKENGFPQGTMHLKDFRWKDSSFFDLFSEPFDRKVRTITSILNAFPERKFILVGDSGEKDPEVYGELARKHPRQIQRILIRDLNGADAEAERYRKAFRDVPRKSWTVWDSSASSPPRSCD